MRGNRDCNRKWYFEYNAIHPIVPPAGEGQKYGTANHWVAENWLKHGTPPSMCPLPPAANEDKELAKYHAAAKEIFPPGVQFLPTPGTPGLVVEHPFKPEGGGLLLDCGATFTGTMDAAVMLPGLPRAKLYDHKTTKHFRYMKTVEELLRDPQALGYGYGLSELTGAEKIEARWIYYRRTKPYIAQPVDFVMTRPLLERAWKRINVVAAEMLDLYNSRKDPLQVTPNESTCDKYGGCYFKSICHGKDGRPIMSNGSTIFQQLKNKAVEAQAAPSNVPGANAFKAAAERQSSPVASAAEDDDDIFGGPSTPAQPVNPPLTPPSPAKVQGADAFKAAAERQAPPENAPPPQAEPKKRKTKEAVIVGGKESENAIQLVEDRPLAIFVDCIPLKGFRGMTSVIDAFAPAFKKAAELQGVANWRLIDWGKGDGVVAASAADLLDAGQITGALLLDTGTKEGRALLPVLETYAAVVVRAFR